MYRKQPALHLGRSSGSSIFPVRIHHFSISKPTANMPNQYHAGIVSPLGHYTLLPPISAYLQVQLCWLGPKLPYQVPGAKNPHQKHRGGFLHPRLQGLICQPRTLHSDSSGPRKDKQGNSRRLQHLHLHGNISPPQHIAQTGHKLHFRPHSICHNEQADRHFKHPIKAVPKYFHADRGVRKHFLCKFA